MTRVNNFVENGGRLCRTLARFVSVDVDPNVQKKNFKKISRFVSGGYPGFSQPAKTAYQHRERFGNGLGKSFAPMGRFWCEQQYPAIRAEMELPATQIPIAGTF